MSEAISNVETLLRQALAPVDPPEDLVARLESTLTNLAEIAAEELDAWELSAMRDPRNWLRPAAAIVVGSTAGAALVVVRARQRAKHRLSHGVRDAAERALHDVSDEARRLLGR